MHEQLGWAHFCCAGGSDFGSVMASLAFSFHYAPDRRHDQVLPPLWRGPSYRIRTSRARRMSPSASGTLANVVTKGLAAAMPREVGS